MESWDKNTGKWYPFPQEFYDKDVALAYLKQLVEKTPGLKCAKWRITDTYTQTITF